MFDTVPLFSGLSAVELATLEKRAKSKRYRKNTVIIDKGDEAATLYVLVRGKVRVYIADENGKEIVLNTCDEPGGHFGELALLRKSPRTASVMTLEESEFKVISRHDFITCLTESPQIALSIISHLADKVDSLTEQISTLALDDVYGRLARILKKEAVSENGRQITRPITQQEIAQMIGASREMVGRIFKELRAGEYIQLEGKRVILNKKLPARW